MSFGLGRHGAVTCSADALGLGRVPGCVSVGEGRADDEGGEDAVAVGCRADDVQPATPATTPAPRARTPRLLMDVTPPVCAYPRLFPPGDAGPSRCQS